MEIARNAVFWLKKSMVPGVILLVLVLVVGLRFAKLAEKTREGTTVGHLYEIRQAVLLYYQDHNGVFPKELSPGSPFSRYLEKVPPVEHLHPRNNSDSPQGAEITYGTAAPQGFGRGWYYNYENGQVFINSIGQDSRGISYTTY